MAETVTIVALGWERMIALRTEQSTAESDAVLDGKIGGGGLSEEHNQGGMRFVSWWARSARHPLEIVKDILSKLSLTQICVLLHYVLSSLFPSGVIM